MSRRRTSPDLSPRRALLLIGVMLWPLALPAADLLRSGRAATAGKDAAATAPATVAPVAAPAIVSAQDRLARTTQTLAAVRQMQQAARALAASAAGPLKPGLPVVPANSFGVANGLVVARGVPADLARPAKGDDTSLWVGADLPAVATTTTGDTTASTVTIKQNQQQAVLTWDSFNVGATTTLAFDQSAGGADVGQWIAFNKVNTVGSPSQILGRIKADGQVYVINPNGIIFGGTAQVNTHALVASSLPINDRLVERGLLNNPDAQFLFSGLALPAGPAGPTGAFVPRLSEDITGATGATSARTVTDLSSVALSYLGDDRRIPLTLLVDYTVASDPAGRAVISLMPDGLAKVAGRHVDFAYTPAAREYGNVEVQAGATLYAPTSADHVGGRVALFGPNVTNAGTLSAPDGQVLLAAGLQVGLAAHQVSDPSLRGLDVYVGRVADPLATDGYKAGVVTNARVTDADGNVAVGLIETTDLASVSANGQPTLETRPGAVTMAGRTVNQDGVIDTATTVAFNGRVDLLASYNAVSNAFYDATLPGSTLFVHPTGETTGDLTLGAGSLVRILPSASLTEKVNRTQAQGLALHSQVNLTGRSVHLASDVAGDAATVPDDAAVATLVAPSADVTVRAGTWALTSPGTKNQLNTFLAAGGQIYLDRGTRIDVAGTQAAPASVTENIVDVQLRGAELADSPLQRDGPLRGQTVKVDARVHGPWDLTLNGGLGGYTWVGTPLADASGWISLVGRTAGELTTAGGTVNLTAGGSVVLRPGAQVDVSGGWIDYQGGTIETTKLLADGRIYDISQAAPTRRYDAILNGATTTTDAKWGVTTTTQKPTRLGYYDPGYLQGGSAGKVAITAPSVALDGEFAGRATSGSRQILTTPAAGANDLMARPGEFALKFSAQRIDPDLTTDVVVENYSPLPPNVTFQSGAALAAAAPVAAFAVDPTGAYLLPTRRQDEVSLDPALVGDAGFGFLRVDNSDDNFGTNGRTDPAVSFGRIIVPVAAAPVLDFGPGTALARTLGLSSLSLAAANLDLLGGIRAAGGSLAFSARNISSSLADRSTRYTFDITAPDPLRGTVTVGAAAVLDTAGRVNDYRLPSVPSTTPVVTAGGAISLSAYRATVLEGARMDVSGGATLGATGSVAWGTAGSISLGVANEQLFEGAKLVLPASYTGANAAAGALRGYSGGTGGELSIRAPLLQVAAAADDTSRLLLRPELFSAGGFASFKLTGLTDSTHPDTPALLVGSAKGTALALAPVVDQFQSNLAKQGAAALVVATPEPLFQSRVQLAFNAAAGNTAVPVPDTAGVVLGTNAAITLQPNAAGAVTFNGDTVAVLGAVTAPGGKVTVAAKGDSTLLFGRTENTVPLATLYLGAASRLSVAGAPQLGTDSQGYTIGSVLDGGTIKVSGNLVAEKGAVLDASGATGAVDVEPTRLDAAADAGGSTSGRTRVRTTLDSNGGSIQVVGAQELVSDATFVARAGGPTAVGGRLTVQSGLFDPAAAAGPELPNLVLVESGRILPAPFTGTAIGQAVTDADGFALSAVTDNGIGYFGGILAATSFADGGFDALTFKGNVKYSGAVSLHATGSIALGAESGSFGGVIVADVDQAKPSSLSLNAPYVALGTAFADPGVVTRFAKPVAPTYGTGTVTVTGAKLIDVGNLSLRGVGRADLATTDGGDVRGSGTLDVAGALTVKAGQVYPPTAATFTLAAYDPVSPVDGAPVLDDAGLPLTGSITITRAGTAAALPPLSAGGTLNLHATTITQNGTLRAPLGRINLGYDPAGGAAPTDALTGAALPVAKLVTLGADSLTSVSLTDPATGKPLVLPVPYGLVVKGAAWIDPTGADISVTDPAHRTAKQVTVAATTVDTRAGSTIDVAGGGDLYAYEWVKGTNGTQDVLDARLGAGFAIIPGYGAAFAPAGAFAGAQANLNGDAGYVSLRRNADGADESRLAPGDSLYLDLNDGLGFRTFTLLPARYALLPGAYLVTAKSGVPTASVAQADGSRTTAAFRYNALDQAATFRPYYSNWEIAPAAVVRARAEYRDSLGSGFLPASALAHDVTIPRLPADAGRLTLVAGESMSFKGAVSAQPLKRADGTALGLGGEVDIASSRDIVITGPTAAAPAEDALGLDAKVLSDLGVDSLLVGGVRATGADNVTTVTVRTGNLTVDNAGQALTAPDVVLAANGRLTLAPAAEVRASGAVATSAPLLEATGRAQLSGEAGREAITFARGGTPIDLPVDLPAGAALKASVSGLVIAANGTTTAFAANTAIPGLTAGSALQLDGAGTLTATFGPKGGTIPLGLGDGALLRVSTNAAAAIHRTGVAGSTAPIITLGAGAKVAGTALVLDSTQRTALDPTASLSAQAVALSSGQVSLALTPGVGSPQGLVLGSEALAALQSGAKSLSLSSYSTLDIYGHGQVGATDSSGAPLLAQLGLHAAAVRAYDDGAGGATVLAAQQVTLDNAPGGQAGSPAAAGTAGTLRVTANSLTLGTGDLALERFAGIELAAPQGVTVDDRGSLTTGSDLTVTTNRVTGTAGADYRLTVAGDLALVRAAGAATAATSGIGARLAATADQMTIDTDVTLHSGSLALRATTGDLTIGANGAATLDLTGTRQTFFDVDKFTAGGALTLQADAGDVALAAGAVADVSAPAAGGDAGALAIAAPAGLVTHAGTLRAQGGTGGAGGRFTLDVGSFAGGLKPLLAALNPAVTGDRLGGFTAAQSIRVRHGDVLLDGTAAARDFSLAVDGGSLVVGPTGRVVAVAPADGAIDPARAGATGGSINLAASGSLTLNAGAALSVAATNHDAAGKGGAVTLAAGQPVNGVADTAASLTLAAGSTIDLSVATPAGPGEASGRLHLRAPRTAAGTEVQVGSLAATIKDPSSVVVEGVKVYDLAASGGVVDSVKGTVETDNVLFATTSAAAVTARLTAGLGAAAAAFHLQPGVELINSAAPATTTTLTALAPSGSSLVTPAAGGTLFFPGTAGAPLASQVRSTLAGTIKAADGTVTALPANTATTLAKGSTITLAGAGVVTFTGSTALDVTVSPGTAVTAGATGATLAADAVSGRLLRLTTAGSSSLTTTAANTLFTFPLGTPGNNRVTATGSGVVGTVTSASGTTNLTGGVATALPAGAVVKLNASGARLTFASGGTGGAIPVTVAAGTSAVARTAAIGTGVGDLVVLAPWDFSAARYGAGLDPAVPGSGEPGQLTLRAAGNLVFNYNLVSTSSSVKTLTAGSLSDGFRPLAAANGGLWQAPLLDPGTWSWGYRLVAGADLAGADSGALTAPSALPAASGSVLLGYGAAAVPVGAAAVASTLSTSTLVPQYFQTIRTGTGDIRLSAARDIAFLNPLATVYTAGTAVANPTTVSATGDFDLPNTQYRRTNTVGSVQQFAVGTVFFPYASQYSFGGGDVSLQAGNDIVHQLVDPATGRVTADSSKELPTSWLYRRGYVDESGRFGPVETVSAVGNIVKTETASTSWWVDFSNFFEGVGALGGGHVALTAGRNVTNVDAAVPTNARFAGRDATGTAATPATAAQVELGGGDLRVRAGGDIDGGVYFVGRGRGELAAGGSVRTNATRTTLTPAEVTATKPAEASTWMPTTLFLGTGSFAVAADGDVLLGSVANPFLLPQGINNSYFQRTFFSTSAPANAVRVQSLQGRVDLVGSSARDGSLWSWYANVLNFYSGNSATALTLASVSQPWLRTIEATATGAMSANFQTSANLLPGTLDVTAFGGDVALFNDLNLAPAPKGNLGLFAAGSINGLGTLQTAGTAGWTYGTINLSDADPTRIPGVRSPQGTLTARTATAPATPADLLSGFQALFRESGETEGGNVVLQTQLALHGPRPDDTPGAASHALHGGDPEPLRLYAAAGDVSGVTLFSPKSARVLAARDISDVGLYLQNVGAEDISLVSAGRDLVPYNPNSALRTAATAAALGNDVLPRPGDLQVSGPGTLEVLAGRNLTLGAADPFAANGLGLGITSIGNLRNPRLPFSGADLVLGAGLGVAAGLDRSSLDVAAFASRFLDPATAGDRAVRYLPEVARRLGVAIDAADPVPGRTAAWAAYTALPEPRRALLALDLFYRVLRDAGRDHNDPKAGGFGTFNAGYEAVTTLFGRNLAVTNAAGTGFVDRFLDPVAGGANAAHYLPELGRLLGATGDNAAIWAQYRALPADDRRRLALQLFATVLADPAAPVQPAADPATPAPTARASAIAALFTGQLWSGDIALSSRSIRTRNGGDIALFAPGGGISLGYDLSATTLAPPGILTEHGGDISLFAHRDIDIGTMRIFTLRGGNEVLWSTTGNIAAGRSSKTVQSAPPTQVLVDPQSANVKTDLAGLATGGGIGVLATVAGVPPGDVDLIAPVGAIDAGDAGIRSSGNLNLAAQVVLNSTNIQVGGVSTGSPAPAAAPSLGTLASASATSTAASSAAADVAKQAATPAQAFELPSVISVEVLGYGGEDEDGETAATHDDEAGTRT